MVLRVSWSGDWDGALQGLGWAGAVALSRDAHISESRCGAPGFVALRSFEAMGGIWFEELVARRIAVRRARA
jgi:hypothetical protein